MPAIRRSRLRYGWQNRRQRLVYRGRRRRLAPAEGSLLAPEATVQYAERPAAVAGGLCLGSTGSRDWLVFPRRRN